jgi:predicted aspartyl protease
MTVVGNFVESDKPVVQASIAWNQSVQTPHFILDTGFTGDLAVNSQIATELGLEISGVMPARFAGNTVANVPTATAIAAMEGERLYVTVAIIDGWPLLGISFMEKFKYKAEVDCRNKTVRLEVVT